MGILLMPLFVIPFGVNTRAQKLGIGCRLYYSFSAKSLETFALWPLSWMRSEWFVFFPCTRLGLRTNLVDPASSHMLVSKIKPCMSKYKLLYGETANGSLKQL